MGRRPNPQRREELLDEILAYVQRNGLANLSLRPLANALGTSTYTLTYQFGSKQELLASILDELRRRERRAPHNSEPMPLADRIEALWAFVQTVEGRAFHRLRLEGIAATLLDEERAGQPPPTVADLIGIGEPIDLTDSAHSPADPIVDDQRVQLIAPDVATELDRDHAVTEATTVWATIEGLILDYLASGDIDRVGAAVDSLTERLRTERAPAL